MPYRKNDELPESVKGTLPVSAQDIYRSAFNHVWQECRGMATPASVTAPTDQVAHKVAWAAVKRRFELIGGDWQPKY
ncbi:ChaB family protein [Azospirillum sp. SYSU D00513]|uniref:ChaB family protein n=1 Tax=Azospirillum sp. SYSU D00513 TaxID=2812561 RepID=UPI001A979D26|nr:ChaB family protein [Azospirillum sp. SYSU D00513]